MSSMVDQFLATMRAGDVPATLDLYADDAEVVSYSRHAVGRNEIGRWLTAWHVGGIPLQVIAIDQLKVTPSVVMCSLTLETDTGAAQSEETFVLVDGRIWRHISTFAGWWGR